MQDTVSMKEVLESTLDQLSKIQIPAVLSESVGIPITHAIVNISACLEAMKENEEGKDNGSETHSA